MKPFPFYLVSTPIGNLDDCLRARGRDAPLGRLRAGGGYEEGARASRPARHPRAGPLVSRSQPGTDDSRDHPRDQGRKALRPRLGRGHPAHFRPGVPARAPARRGRDRDHRDSRRVRGDDGARAFGAPPGPFHLLRLRPAKEGGARQASSAKPPRIPTRAFSTRAPTASSRRSRHSRESWGTARSSSPASSRSCTRRCCAGPRRSSSRASKRRRRAAS